MRSATLTFDIVAQKPIACKECCGAGYMLCPVCRARGKVRAPAARLKDRLYGVLASWYIIEVSNLVAIFAPIAKLSQEYYRCLASEH
jgi:hypothetical protein